SPQVRRGAGAGSLQHGSAPGNRSGAPARAARRGGAGDDAAGARLALAAATTQECIMNDPLPSTTNLPQLSDRTGVTDSVRAQLLATEHWSLLATRSMTWNEVFSRASMFITVLSAAVVALALVAQATAFGPSFRLFALLILPVVLLAGLATLTRLGNANMGDFWLGTGVERLRHAHLGLAPELGPHFVSPHAEAP